MSFSRVHVNAGLNLLIDLVARYEPKCEDETYALMNLIDPVLRSANSGAVLATVYSHRSCISFVFSAKLNYIF